MLRSIKLVGFIIGFACALSLSLAASPATAVDPSSWRAGNIIHDAVFTRSGSMTIDEIQAFLNSKVPNCDTWGNGTSPYWAPDYNGDGRTSRAEYGQYRGNNTPFTCLKDYREVPKNSPGGGIPSNNYGNINGANPPTSKSAAEIIWQAAQDYNINPKVLLVTLQKESGLITDDWTFRNQLVYAMGAHCPDSGPGGSANCDPNYGGFSLQIRESADLLRYYLDNMQQPWWGNKRPYQNNFIQYDVDPSCGGSNVYMENRATTALYVYTPYQPSQAALNAGYGSAEPCGAYGNRNFWLYFHDWFGSTQATVPYAWQYVTQEAYVDAARTIKYTSTPTTQPNGKVYVRVKALNIGYQTWQGSSTRIGTSRPIDTPSIFASSNWISNTRAANLKENSIMPGQVGTFEFELQSPPELGSYSSYFNLLIEGVAWLNDPGLYFTVNANNPRPVATEVTYTLSGSQSLNTEQRLTSQDTQSTLKVDRTGNVALLQNHKIVWSASGGGNSNTRLMMQPDGNLVLYTTSGVPLWNSETQGNPGARLVLQQDGNLVIYSASNAPLWATYTIHTPDLLSYVNTTLNEGYLHPMQALETADGKYRLILQPDGNLVLYKNGNQPVWASGTDGKQVAFLALQPDGNLVLYSKDYRPLWSTGTANRGAFKLIIQPDGNLVLYTIDNRPLWATYTNGR